MQPSADRALDHERSIAWTFVFVQLILLAAVILLPAGDVWSTPGWLSVGAHVVAILGLVVIGIALVNLGGSATPLPTPVKDGELRSNGLYRYVRHPIYSGVMVFAIGWAVPSGSVGVAAAAVALVVWLSIKARWEERHLDARYPGYGAYADRTPRFVPSWRTRSVSKEGR